MVGEAMAHVQGQPFGEPLKGLSIQLVTLTAPPTQPPHLFLNADVGKDAVNQQARTLEQF